MPYASGEVPVPGDYVKNQWEQSGTVIRVSVASNGEESVTVRWDDGGVDSPLTSNGIYSDFKASLAPSEEHCWVHAATSRARLYRNGRTKVAASVHCRPLQ